MDSTSSARRRPILALRLLRALLTLGWTALFLAAPLGPLAWAQGGRLDQVFVRDSRGSVRQFSGTVTENSLTRVVLQRGDKDTPYDNDRVDRIIWGEVSVAFRDGKTFFERGDFENAAAKFGQAAVEDPRDVIKAVARLHAGMALMQLGSTDASRYTEAIDEVGRFLTDFPDDRAVPEARMLQARCTLLRGGEGDQAAAGALYRSLFEEGAGAETPSGYDLFTCLECGLHGAHALLGGGDTAAARELFGILGSTVRSMLVTLDEQDPGKARLEALAGQAQLGEGYLQLASLQASQAETFFQAQLQNAANGPAAVRFGARLGLGEAYFAQGKLREATIEFAVVTALDFTDRDRTAHAMLRLAEALGKIGDIDGATQSRQRLTALVEHFGDTPSAAKARDLLK